MAGNYPEFKTGTKIKAFDSSFLNALVGMANAQPTAAPGGADTMARPADTILVLNSTGADLELGMSAMILNPMVDAATNEPQFTTNLVMEATWPVSDEGEGSFGVAMQPIKDGTIGRMCVSGLCPAQLTVPVDLEDATRCELSGPILRAGETGSAQIMWKEGGTGLQWAIVRFGSVSEYTVKTDSTDSTAGYLDDEIEAGASISTFVDAGSADHTLVIGHGSPGEILTTTGAMVGEPTGGNDITVVGVQPATDAYIKYKEYVDNADEFSHSLVDDLTGAFKYIVIPLYKIKVNAADAAPDYLDAKLKMNRAGASQLNWLRKAIVGTQEELSHATLLETGFGEGPASTTVMTLLTPDGTNFEAGAAAAGYCSFTAERVDSDYDAAGHFTYETPPTDDPVYRWLALPEGTTAGDMLRWDGAKWVTIAAPSASSDFVLTSQSGTISWVELDAFACP